MTSPEHYALSWPGVTARQTALARSYQHERPSTFEYIENCRPYTHHGIPFVPADRIIIVSDDHRPTCHDQHTQLYPSRTTLLSSSTFAMARGLASAPPCISRRQQRWVSTPARSCLRAPAMTLGMCRRWTGRPRLPASLSLSSTHSTLAT
jgi:hypothetical protein